MQTIPLLKQNENQTANQLYKFTEMRTMKRGLLNGHLYSIYNTACKYPSKPGKNGPKDTSLSISKLFIYHPKLEEKYVVEKLHMTQSRIRTRAFK